MPEPQSEAARWKRLYHDATGQRVAHAGWLLLFGAIAGALLSSAFNQGTYEAARRNPEEAAEGLCAAGYSVTAPGVGELCSD